VRKEIKFCVQIRRLSDPQVLNSW